MSELDDIDGGNDNQSQQEMRMDNSQAALDGGDTILIRLESRGNQGAASCAHGTSTARTLALALSTLVKELAKNPELIGQQYVTDWPRMTGEIRKPKPRKKKQKLRALDGTGWSNDQLGLTGGRMNNDV